MHVPSQFDEAQLQKVKQRPTDKELGQPPTKNEVRRALAKLRNGKVPGSSNILLDMVKAGRCNGAVFGDGLECCHIGMA